MSICSRHREVQKDCAACNCVPERDIPGFKEALERAEAAGEYKCLCGFVYYKTILFCPKCGLTTKTSIFHKTVKFFVSLLLFMLVSCSTIQFVSSNYAESLLLVWAVLMIAYQGDRDFRP